MSKYIPTLDEIQFADKNARKILKEYFEYVSDLDVITLRKIIYDHRAALYGLPFDNEEEED